MGPVMNSGRTVTETQLREMHRLHLAHKQLQALVAAIKQMDEGEDKERACKKAAAVCDHLEMATSLLQDTLMMQGWFRDRMPEIH